jgi:hypothetical protein
METATLSPSRTFCARLRIKGFVSGFGSLFGVGPRQGKSIVTKTTFFDPCRLRSGDQEGVAVKNHKECAVPVLPLLGALAKLELLF